MHSASPLLRWRTSLAREPRCPAYCTRAVQTAPGVRTARRSLLRPQHSGPCVTGRGAAPLRRRLSCTWLPAGLAFRLRDLTRWKPGASLAVAGAGEGRPLSRLADSLMVLWGREGFTVCSPSRGRKMFPVNACKPFRFTQTTGSQTGAISRRWKPHPDPQHRAPQAWLVTRGTRPGGLYTDAHSD